MSRLLYFKIQPRSVFVYIIMDITFKTENGCFNYRVCAIIINDNDLLAMRDETAPHYYLPGGRVKLNETAENAIMREIREELEIDAEIVRPLWLSQAYFKEDVTHEQFHELCLYFLVDVSRTDLMKRGCKFTLHEGHHTHTFEWLPFEQLKNKYLYPLFIKEKIYNLPEELTLITNIE